MIYDLVTNGLVRLNLPLELNFLCIRLSSNFDLVIFSCIMCMKILWLASICGDFLILFKKIMFFLVFLRVRFQFYCMYFGKSTSSKKSVYFWS